MRVIEISLHRARLPLVHGFETSSHRKGELEHVIVRFVDESGTVGWGEIASPSHPYFSAENVGTTWSIASDYVVPAILGASWETPGEVGALLRRIRGNYFAIAGFDMAGGCCGRRAKGSRWRTRSAAPRPGRGGGFARDRARSVNLRERHPVRATPSAPPGFVPDSDTAALAGPASTDHR